ncbi:ATR-interacting protein mus304 isoform X2 [Eurosta solidaginis]
MAKRFPTFKEFGRSTKKPKLDVSVNKGRPLGPSQSWPHHIRSFAAAVAAVDSPVRNSVSNNNLWDDDDDDVILLATQVAESQAATKMAAENNITDSDITFSEFAPHVHATTSTQRLATITCATVKSTISAPPTTKIPDKHCLSELFADDDDFAEILIEATNDKKEEHANIAQEEFQNVFKKPTTITSGTNGWSNKGPVHSSGVYTQESQNTAARRQVATERQVKLLMERLDALKTENAKLTKELGESKAKIESKDGETTLLRDELRHMKQQMQTLKMEKLMSTEAAKSECKTKLAELSKRVEAKESELKLRNVEYSVLKMRHADETQRLETSIRNANYASDLPMDAELETTHSSSRTSHTLYRLRGLNLTKTMTVGVGLTELSANAYERTQEPGVSRQIQHTPFQQELTNAQTLLAQLQIQQQKRLWTNSEALAFSECAIKSVCNALPEFWTYVHGLEFPKHCNVHPYHDYELLKDVQRSHTRDLHAVHKLHADERAISLRRYVALLSVMCAQAPNFAHQLLEQPHGEYALLQVACQAIAKLGYSREICAHFGTLEAFAALLRVLLQQLRNEDENEKLNELLVGGLLKELIFVRPSAWIFRELSYCILELTHVPPALTLLCVNSDESTFYSDRMRSIYRFSNDSCILQVYAGLLEITFPLNGVLSEAHFRLLTTICENHVRLAHFCFMKPPEFIHKLLPSYEDDEEGDDETETEMFEQQVVTIDRQQSHVESVISNNSGAATTTTIKTTTNSGATPAARCECYTKLCLSVVTLLFQLMRQWQCTGRNIETPRVAEVSQISVQLLYTIFCDNYSTRLFRYAEETTKHYLWLICEWWSENAEHLKFNNVHKNFLNKLRTFHIMPKQLKEDGNSTNVINDLNDWNSLTNDSAATRQYAGDASAVAHLAKAAEYLNILRCAGGETKFFEGLKGYAFNFE